MPFQTEVLGVEVTVRRVDVESSLRSQLAEIKASILLRRAPVHTPVVYQMLPCPERGTVNILDDRLVCRGGRAVGFSRDCRHRLRALSSRNAASDAASR